MGLIRNQNMLQESIKSQALAVTLYCLYGHSDFDIQQITIYSNAFLVLHPQLEDIKHN
jgi:hypothetical protein